MLTRSLCLPRLAGHLDWEVAMSTMQEQIRSGPVLGPGRTRRSFPAEVKADAVGLVLDEAAASRRWRGA